MAGSAHNRLAPSEVRYAYEPLAQAIGAVQNLAVVADALDVSTGTLARWRQDGLSQWRADRAAIAIGSHPALIWPTWISDGLAVAP